MNQIKFFLLPILILISTILLTACTDESYKNKTNHDIEISQDQHVEEELNNSDGNKFESNSGELNQSLIGSDKDDNAISSNFNAAESGSNDETLSGSNNLEEPHGQSVPSLDLTNPAINDDDQQADSDSNLKLTYKEYISMSPMEQKAYYDSYENFMDFLAWHNAAKAEYDAENESIEIQDGKIDIGEIADKIN